MPETLRTELVELVFAKETGKHADPFHLRQALQYLVEGSTLEHLSQALAVSENQMRKMRTVDHLAPPSITQLLKCGDEDFLRDVFRHLLGRDPDFEGAMNYFRHLRHGRPRTWIITEIRLSSESRRWGTSNVRPWSLFEIFFLPSVSFRERAGLFPVVTKFLFRLSTFRKPSEPEDRF